MIKFFKHVRKRLLSENKITKYLAYAFGEIILVVIGILIALQINNWNQERLATIESKSIVKAIYNDLVKDTVLLNKYIGYYEELLPYNNILIERSQSDHTNFDTIRKIANDFKPTFWQIPSFHNTTLSSIESSGKLELLEESLKKELLEYQQLQIRCLDKSNTGIYIDILNDYYSKYTTGEVNGKYLKALFSNIEDEKEYVHGLTTLVGYKSFLMSSSKDQWENTLIKARKIILILEEMNHD